MDFLRRAAVRSLRLLPGSKARALARDWRDRQRLAEADAAIVSFPKSGRTFVRVMLARLYQRQFGIDEREVLDFATLRDAPANVPRTLFTHDGDAMRPPPQISVSRKHYRNKKVALLARHPGDVAVSRYYHLKHRSRDRARQRLARQPLEDFVWTAQGGIPSIVRFLNQWAQLSRERPGILIVRYEDFLSEPEATLAKLAHFIGLDSDAAQIKDAVEFARLENLRKKEQEGYFTSDRLGARKAGDDQSFKVRAGKSGGYRAQLSEAEQDAVQSYIRENLDPVFGYER